jgi:hypothetical protein
MLDIEDYASAWQHLLAWGIYLMAAGIVCLAFLRLTRRWQQDIRLLLFALIAVFLLVPAPVPGRTLLAPAMIFVVLSPVTGTPEILAGVFVRLMLAAIAAIILVILAGIWRRWRRRAQ